MASCYKCVHFSWSDSKPYCNKYYTYNSVDYAEYNQCAGFDSGSSSSSSSNDGCFLTSACVNHMGKPDNCEELTALRRFRDTYMKSTENGRKSVEEYYSIAPKIVAQIDKSADKDSVYNEIYGVIVKCIADIERGNNAFAEQRYCDMVNSLKLRFLKYISARKSREKIV